MGDGQFKPRRMCGQQTGIKGFQASYSTCVWEGHVKEGNGLRAGLGCRQKPGVGQRGAWRGLQGPAQSRKQSI